MKKSILIITIVSGLILAILYWHKDDSEKCTKCKEGPSIPTTGTVLNHTFTFKHFYRESDGHFFQTHTNKNEFEDIIQHLPIASAMNPNEDIAILITYLSSSYDTTFNMDTQSILGYLIYYFDNDKLYTRVIKVVDGKLEEQKYFSSATDRVDLGEIYEIGRFVISSQTYTTIYIGNKDTKGTSLYNTNQPILQYKLALRRRLNLH